MSQEHRYLRGDVKEIILPVHGNTVIEKGDFVVCEGTLGSVTRSAAKSTAADFYCYPVSDCTGSTSLYFANNFAGIAMKGSASGTTENIPVATAGIFRYPLLNTTGVTASLVVSMATTAPEVLADQIVLCGHSTVAGVSQLAVGFCVKTEAAATKVDFTLITRFSGVSYFDMARS